LRPARVPLAGRVTKTEEKHYYGDFMYFSP
jgi:hypothetical protein